MRSVPCTGMLRHRVPFFSFVVQDSGIFPEFYRDLRFPIEKLYGIC